MFQPIHIFYLQELPIYFLFAGALQNRRSGGFGPQKKFPVKDSYYL